MKRTAFILIALALVTFTASAQNPASITLSSTVTAYADGDKIGTALFVTNVNMYGDDYTGFIESIDATVDSVFTGAIEFMALWDTTGVMQYLAADNAAFVLTSGIRAKRIGSITVNFTNGTTYSYGNSGSWFKKYRLNAAKKIYWIPIARSAYTYKQSGTIQLTPWYEENGKK